jgi:hypothetical protein
MVWEPIKDAIDPSTLDHRIRIGDSLGSGWSKERSRNIDVNEWVQFQHPGRYVLHVVLTHIIPVRVAEENTKPWMNCELKSNTETIEILPRDIEWETAELVRIGRLLESETTRFGAASPLRYLDTPEAAVALAHWYLRLSDGLANSELTTGIFESRYAEIVQRELDNAVRSGVPFTQSEVGTLTLLEVRRQFKNRPLPSDPEAARAWSRDYWKLFD